MSTELDLLSLTQLQKLAHTQHNQNQHHHQPDTGLTSGLWTWYPKAQTHEPDDDSWEVRAFAEDTSNALGTTWPPRSYICTFCRREFRSAQALGGHMNIHRRDRAARLHQAQPGNGASSSTTTTTTTSSTLLIQPTQEFATTGGLCLLYQLHNRNGVFTSPPPPINAWSIIDSSPYPSYNLMAEVTRSINFPISPPPVTSSSSSFCYSTKAEHSMTLANTSLDLGKNTSNCKETSIEELDLELRLGHRCPTTS